MPLWKPHLPDVARDAGRAVIAVGGEVSDGGGEIYLTPTQIAAAQPASTVDPGRNSRDHARARMVATGQWGPAQSMGRRWPIGCVALEITQRCNLDCTACYLSEHSEAVKDLPLGEVFRRIDMIFAHYGRHTSVQVTGGDPTLRKRDELIAIVRRIYETGMRPALFTNGIKATRGLLIALCEAGLEDVAFHVDLTQGRRGYSSESALNAVRADYIERARGLPLGVYFNTTVFDGNFAQIPEVVTFFVRNSDVVRLASFQPKAETGRGIGGKRGAMITMASVAGQIAEGAGTALSFDTVQAGHASCNRYAMALIANGHAYDFLDHPGIYGAVLRRAADLQFDRRHPRRAIRTLIGCLLRNPDLVARGAPWFVGKLWRMRADLVAARGRATKLSFFIHNFMDACHLEPARIEACIFMAATGDGPISMCLHNAKRDAFILQPVKVTEPDGERFWNPLSGSVTATPPTPPAQMPPVRPRSARSRARG
ncbi:MAG: radical SAM protein [Stellaceae bacterium]